MTATRSIVILTGMSGSGKSTAIRALEDVGFFCIDNMPAPLLPKVAELSSASGESRRLAFVIDARERMYLSETPRVLAELKRAGHRVDVLFLDSSDETLIRRFSETRRRHPLSERGSVEEGIAQERALLETLRAGAEHLIDTSNLTVHELKQLIQSRFAAGDANVLALSVMSFGFRHGLPQHADMVLDVRFLPNPHFVPELRPLTGVDPPVQSFVVDRPESQEFIEKVVELLRFLLPRYQREGKAYVTVAIGCTGGKHRSVAMAAEIARRIGEGVPLNLVHRDVTKDELAR